jgi:uncharacterized protein involved in outer membrane biogenesis
MKRVSRFWKLVLTVLTLLVVSMVLLFTLDLGFLRPNIESRISQMTGRQVSLGEAFSLRLDDKLYISGDALRVSNADWATDPVLLQSGAFSLVIDARSLLGDTPVIENLLLEDLAVYLEQSADGMSNWVFNDPGEVPDETGTLGFLLESASVNNSHFEFKSPSLDRPVVASIVTLEEGVNPDDQIALKIVGVINERDVSFEVVGFPYSRMVDGNDFRIDGMGQFGQINLSGGARLDQLWGPERPEFNLNIEGPELEELTNMLGIEELGNGSLSFSAIGKSVSGRLETEILGNFGEFEIDVNANISSLKDIRDLILDGEVSGPNFGRIANLAGFEGMPPEPFTIRADLARRSQGVTDVDVQLELPQTKGSALGQFAYLDGLAGTDIRVSVEGRNAADWGVLHGIQGLPGESWKFETRLSSEEAERIELSGTRFETEGLAVTLEGSLGPELLHNNTKLSFSINGEHLSGLQKLLAVEDMSFPDEPFSLSGRIRALDGRWELADIKASSGALEIKLGGHLGAEDLLVGANLDVDVAGTNIGDSFSLPGGIQLPHGEFSAAGNLAFSGERLVVSGMNVSGPRLQLSVDADVPLPLDLSNGNFAITGHGADITSIVKELAGFTLDEAGFDLATEGQWKDGTIRIKQGRLSIAEAEFTAGGSLDLPPNLAATDFDVTLVSPDLSRLGTFDGARWDTLPVDLKTSFTGTRHKVKMDGFRAQLGQSNLFGAFEIDFEPETPVFTASLSTPSLDLRPFQDTLQSDSSSDVDTGPVFTEQEIPMSFLASANGTFELQADELFTRRMRMLNNRIKGEVLDGRLNIDRMSTDGYRGQLASHLSITPDPDYGARLSFSANSSQLILNLTGHSPQDMTQMPAFDVDLKLEATGSTLRDLAASMNGYINTQSTGGQVRNVQKESAKDLLLAKLFSSISPSTAKQEVIEISCVAAIMKVSDGVLSLDPGIALQSEKLNVFATGNINLGTEKIDVNFRTQTRNAAKVSASELISPYVKLSGTLANPSVAIDPKGTLLSGGAAYLSGGLSILAKKALGALTTTEDPCAGHLEKARGNG